MTTNLSSYFCHQQHHYRQQQHYHQSIAAPSAMGATTAMSPTDGLLGNTDGTHSHMLYPHTVLLVLSVEQSAKRKRGRLRCHLPPLSFSPTSSSSTAKKSLHHQPHALGGSCSLPPLSRNRTQLV
ncbi:hypothetical protein PIB30_007431 [Stylosanthes scabra]|uniref:Uncharacterized protein n=1 Tax=Stylosanthes scabra TaxID=79078 RepID=A0ABU6Q4L3_9FABA|nr:hypothetical protein [Stylosanthes scabra]